jgi:hypothetical protein
MPNMKSKKVSMKPKKAMSGYEKFASEKAEIAKFKVSVKKKK